MLGTEKTNLDRALELANLGFFVFPLIPNAKTPIIFDFNNQASRDPEVIRKWWTDPVMGNIRPYNIGIITSKFGDPKAPQGLIAVDVDVKKKGFESLLKLELEGKILPPTFTQTTPTGGQHYLYLLPEPVTQGADVLGVGIDTRSYGGYVVASGSTIDGKAYTDNNVQVEHAPEWLRLFSRKPEPKQTAPVVPIPIDQERAVRRVIEYLETAPPAIEGVGGDHATFKLAAKVRDFGIASPLHAAELAYKYWNPRCVPPWEYKAFVEKFENAYRYSSLQLGALSPEVQFPPIEPEQNKSYLDKMNEEYALIYIEGSHSILHEMKDDKGAPKRAFMPEASFKRRFSPYTIQEGNGAPRSYADHWLNWKGRREYIGGLVFAPGKTPPREFYNLWRGFTVKPKAYAQASERARRGYDLFKEHLVDNVCRKDAELANWLFGYFAHMIQKPYERPLTTLVFRGKKGTGKNALIDRIGALLGSQHYLVAHNSRYLTSHFNSHMDSCLCLVLDEAFWSGDKAAEGQLKGITTAPHILIERKGEEPYRVDNLTRLVVIGNEEWLVPASQDERRYAVFDVGEGKMQNIRFFKEMRECMEDGGYEVLLDELQRFDLSKAEPNVAPVTAALIDQKIASLPLVHQWWLQSLEDGRLANSSVEKWEIEVSKLETRNALFTYCRNRNISSRMPSEVDFTKLLRSVLPSLDYTQKTKGQRVYRFPPLQQARAEWTAAIGERDWGDE